MTDTGLFALEQCGKDGRAHFDACVHVGVAVRIFGVCAAACVAL